VVVAGKFRKALKIKMSQWKRHFKGFGGVAFKKGAEIEVIPAKSGGPRAEPPAWVEEKLDRGPDDGLCVTERKGKLYLKKLQLVEIASEVPCCVVVDEFGPGAVKRMYALATPVEQITLAGLRRIVSAMGTFRHDPLGPLKRVEGRIGFLARKEFFAGWRKADKDAIKRYAKDLVAGQLDNGSWRNSTIHTAFRLIRLAEVGATRRQRAVAKACNWLLSSPEPAGFPGMFFCDLPFAERFSAWKDGHSGSDRFTKSGVEHTKQAFFDNCDVLGLMPGACEPRVFWASAVAIEALTRCGLGADPRVVNAIGTFLATGGPAWCGNCIFMAKQDFSDAARRTAFGGRQTDREHLLEWPTEPAAVMEKVADDPDYGHHHYKQWAFGRNRSLLMRKSDEHVGGGGCTLIVNRALSWHPDYRASSLPTLCSRICEYPQGWDGSWAQISLSYIFSLLERLDTPLAAFVALRSVPQLIRRQRADGLWQEDVPAGPRVHPGVHPPPKEASTFMILRTLKHFGFLKSLLPR
jgi:hypothetical protein